MDNEAESRSRNPRTGHQRRINYYSHKTKKKTHGQSKSGTGENDELKGVVALRKTNTCTFKTKKRATSGSIPLSPVLRVNRGGPIRIKQSFFFIHFRLNVLIC